MKPGPIIAMILLPLLGLWLIWNRPNPIGDVALRANAEVHHMRIGQSRGLVEVVQEPDGTHSFRLLMEGGEISRELNEYAIESLLGKTVLSQLTLDRENAVFRLLNITSWASMGWIVIGFGGQAIFMSRFLIQWIVSERKQESVIPTSFWWISLFGAVFLFAYFVWRRDMVGLLGQSTGVVIYARNLRLIHKQKLRVARDAERHTPGDPTRDTENTAESTDGRAEKSADQDAGQSERG